MENIPHLHFFSSLVITHTNTYMTIVKHVRKC